MPEIDEGISTSHFLGAWFFLIEVLVIAEIAIPNYIQSKMRANGAFAAQSLRNISTAEIVYYSTYGQVLSLSVYGIFHGDEWSRKGISLP